ncbi:MAG: hypothetical protein Kow0020_01860 [Wenzhouxiangellaceae bacterium]
MQHNRAREPSQPRRMPEFARQVVALLRVQALLVAVAALTTAVVVGSGSALAVMAGGGFGIGLTGLAALRVGAAAPEPGAIVAAFYRAMAMKLLLAGAGFVVVAAWFAEWFVPVLAGYVATLPAYWLALLRSRN